MLNTLAPPPFFRPPLAPDRAAALPDRAVDKYWAARPALVGGEGSHECPLPGCGRRFTMHQDWSFLAYCQISQTGYLSGSYVGLSALPPYVRT